MTLRSRSMSEERQLRIHVEIAKHVTKSRKKFCSGDRVIAGALLGRVRIHVASHAFDFLHDPPSRPPCSAFEEHVLDKMRYATELG